MDRSSRVKDQIAQDAAEWFLRLQDTKAAAECREEFVEWLLRSPDHVEEFLAISRVWGETQGASVNRFPADELIAAALAQREIHNVIELGIATAPGLKRDHSEAPRARTRARPRYLVAAAAAFFVLMLGALIWFVADGGLNPSVIRTDIGEQRSVTLADGSVVDINTDSELRIDLSGTERRLRLSKGEARFKVAKHPQRPFIVMTRQATIRALGTIFNVRAESEQTAVAVLDGRVEVREISVPQADTDVVTHLQLRAGQRAAVSLAGQILPETGPSIERATQWTSRRLIFREEPLAVVVAEFNRYHRKPIRIEDASLAGLRISGTFDSSDPDSLLEYFRRFEHVQVEQDEESIRIFAPASNAAR